MIPSAGMAMPKVDILLLNWNHAHDTLECISSLRHLDYRNHEVVVIDNGSGDDSVAQIRESAPDVRLLRTRSNLGFAGGYNVGLRASLERGSDYIWLLNNDTTTDVGALTAMVSVAESAATIGAVGSVQKAYASPERTLTWGGGHIDHWAGSARNATTPVPAHRLTYLSGASLLLRCDALRDVGLLDERFFFYWEDADLGTRLRRAGWSLAVAPTAVVYHKGSASSGGLGPASTYQHYVRGAYRYFRKHAPVPTVPITIRLVGGALKWAIRGDVARVRSLVAAMRGDTRLT